MPLLLSCAARCVLSPSDRAQHARVTKRRRRGVRRRPGRAGLHGAGALWDAVAVSASDDAARPGHGRRSQPVPLGRASVRICDRAVSGASVTMNELGVRVEQPAPVRGTALWRLMLCVVRMRNGRVMTDMRHGEGARSG